MSLRIGSLCSGYGGLDLGVQAVLGGTVAFHCQYEPPDKEGREDKHQYAARILAHHWPTVPNLGDITLVDWRLIRRLHGPVDVLTAGFPCQDVSLAGLRAGLAEGTRSGLWAHVARCIAVLLPRLVVIENVPGLLSAPADRGLGSDGTPLDEGDGTGSLRAIGAVLGDLADLGYDAEWITVPAADVGAPHQRRRVFILAWRRDAAADADDEGTQRAGQPGREPQRHAAGADRGAADTAGEGREGARVRGWAAERGEAAQDADVAARGERRVAAPGQAQERRSRADARGRGRVSDAGRRGGEAAADTDRGGQPGHPERDGGPEGREHGARRGDADGYRVQRATAADAGRVGQRQDLVDVQPGEPVAARCAAADASGDGRHEGRAESAGQLGRLDAAERSAPAAADADGDAVRQQPLGQRGGGDEAVAAADRAEPADGDERAVVVDWGDYGPAVARWETATQRPAPRPTDDRGRLSPEFVEWMMGLPAGHVTGVPGLPRTAQLKALGNGVVPQQAAYALQLLLARAVDEVPL